VATSRQTLMEVGEAPIHSALASGGVLLQLIAGHRPAATSLDGHPDVADVQYRQFLEALGVAVYTTDAEGGITFFNQAAADFWGRRPTLGELWCGSLRLFWSDGQPMRHDECPMAIALKENRVVRGYEAIAERPDGSRVSFIPYPTPLHDTDGAMVGAVNVLVDVTERNEAEIHRRSALAELRLSNAVKDEFLGLVSHELRTPVTTIFGNARLLQDRGETLPGHARRSMIDDIAADSDRLLGVVENLLLLTRLESGAHPDLEPQVLDHVVRKAVASFRKRHPSRRIRMRVRGPHVIVDADRTYLDLLVENMLSNADKYSAPDEEIQVVVRIAGAEARVTVLDRGIGFAEDQANRLFEPFYRSDEARARANGIGVGLAVCRRVAECQGGRIWAQPRRGGGAVIAFALPLVHEAAEREAAELEAAEPERGSDRAAEGVAVGSGALLVADEEPVLALGG
jgi:PAS domain S-box-containing protein